MPVEEIIKSKTKGKFAADIGIKSSNQQWSNDKNWQRVANPVARNEEKRLTELDYKLLKKRRDGKLLKNMAMEQTYKGLGMNAKNKK